jgi:hypothetical protein
MARVAALLSTFATQNFLQSDGDVYIHFSTLLSSASQLKFDPTLTALAQTLPSEWLKHINLWWIPKSFGYILCGSLMTFTLAFVFLLFCCRYLLTVREAQNENERKSQFKWVCSFLFAFVLIGTYIASGLVEHAAYCVPWLCGFVASLTLFGLVSDSVNIRHNKLPAQVLICCRRYCLSIMLWILCRLQLISTQLLAPRPSSTVLSAVLPVLQTPQTPHSFVRWIDQSTRLALSLGEIAIDPTRKWMTASFRLTPKNTDIVLITSIIDLFNFIMFIAGLLLGSSVLLLLSMFVPLVGLSFAVFGVEWSTITTSSIVDFVSDIFGGSTQTQKGEIFYRGRRMTGERVVYYTLTFTSLTVSAMLLIPLLLLLCAGVLISLSLYPFEHLRRCKLCRKMRITQESRTQENVADSVVMSDEMTSNSNRGNSIMRPAQLLVVSPAPAAEVTAEVATAKATAKATATATATAKTTVESKIKSTCVICWSDDGVDGVHCSDLHFTCTRCLNLHALNIFATMPLDPRRMKSLGNEDGYLRCPLHLPSLGKSMCGAAKYGGQQLLKLVPSTLERVIEARAWAKEQQMFERKTLEYELSVQSLAERYQIDVQIKQDRTLLVEQIRRTMPNARQCGTCHFGPIDHGWCDNLSTHHGETKVGSSKIDNACPKCGWFSKNISNWPQWDGTLPAEVDAATKQREKVRPLLTADLQKMVQQNVLTTEQALEMMPDDGNENAAGNNEEEGGLRIGDLQIRQNHMTALVVSIVWLCCFDPMSILALVNAVLLHPVQLIFGDIGSGLAIFGGSILYLARYLVQHNPRA